MDLLMWLDVLGTVGPIRQMNLSTFLGVSWGVDDCSLWSPVGPCPIGPCPIHRKMREVQLAAGGRQVAPTFPLSVPIQTLPIQTVPIQTLPIQTLPIQTLPGWGGVGWGGVFLVFVLGATGRPFKLYMFLKRGLMSSTQILFKCSP